MMGGCFRGFGTGNGVKVGVGHRKKIVFGQEGGVCNQVDREIMAYGVFNARPLARTFMTNASDPVGLYQRDKTPT